MSETTLRTARKAIPNFFDSFPVSSLIHACLNTVGAGTEDWLTKLSIKSRTVIGVMKMKDFKKYPLMALAFIAGLLIVSQANAQSGSSAGIAGGGFQSSFSPGGFSQQSFAQPAFRAPVQSSFQSFNRFPSQSFARPTTSFRSPSFRSPSFNTFSQPRFVPQQSFRPSFNSFGSPSFGRRGGCVGGKCFR